MKANIKVLGTKELNDMFLQLPKQIKINSVWQKFWRRNSKPFIKAAKSNLNSLKGQRGLSDKKRTNTLKKSIGYFTTKKSRKFMGGFVGPRVKGRFRNEKSGFYGAWVEYGGEVKFGGKGFGENQPYFETAWNSTYLQITQNAMKDAEFIIAKAIKSHEKKLQKFGKFGI
tara:strand:+ start:198 stop:707 length:510 start_codon:yes stop_codon:yes gene_type:complete